MLAKFDWETLEVRRSKIRLAMFYKILNNCIAIQSTSARPFYYRYSFYCWTIPLWNAMLSTLVEEESLDDFKVELANQQILVHIN